MTDTARFQKGDVFWVPEPFRRGSKPRLWLVLAADSFPYPGEEYLCAALTTSNLLWNYELGDDWVSGKDPSKTSYCLPWVVATIKHDAVVNPQGQVTESFANEMIVECRRYLGPQ
ncbi:hypothetical protein E6P09_16005 (plasmid) [Haloferax mediterranei ATCC 33500]|uniref:PemK-like protein n=1 Tax=Haloferax mediterranei (strain ATCC 33500 / DSM 1411 / JCM 8866 / NBRC 14739 / NCIMB 2177 / R-4) TaxID=523841 RepID=A0A059TRM5_HALMT|nr:hypothetical protein BM92_16090 [Haloferax mediterranei ATCC 33500]QCQ77087.1 hypothetical protein E6P09_16005 [Haloferax mediterranei ATCC 33500]